MRYCSFNTRDYLILKHLGLKKDLSVMEIGVGLGSIIDEVIGKVKEYCGVDISYGVIDYLKSIYKHNDSISFYCLDVCKNSSFLNKKFDIIFSADTLEHVESPQGFFNFIERHLKPDGIVLITYPNESKNKHHGIIWFDNKKDLLEVIERAEFRIIALFEVKKTVWHRMIRKLFWEIPRWIILRNKKNPQIFEETEAFKIVCSRNIKTKIFAFYANMVTKLAALFPLYKYFDVGESIQNKILFIHLKHK